MSKTPADEFSPNTQELARRAREDGEEFSKLYARIAPALFTWARLRVLPEIRSLLDPEDLVQEICFRSYERFATYDPQKAGFRAWLFGIANNVLREILARQKRRSRLHGQENTGSSTGLDHIPGDATSVSRRVARDESLRSFIGILEKLDDDEKRLLIYRGLEGLRHAETARLLNSSVDAVEKRWQRLIAKLENSGLPPEIFES